MYKSEEGNHEKNFYVITSRDIVPNHDYRPNTWKQNDVIKFHGTKEELRQVLGDLKIVKNFRLIPSLKLDCHIHTLNIYNICKIKVRKVRRTQN